MRVAVHHTDEHPEPGTVFAYHYGRILDTPDPISGKTIPRETIAEAKLAQAREEFPAPQYEVKLERLQDNGDGTSTWVEWDGEPVGDGAVHDVEVTIEQATAAEEG